MMNKDKEFQYKINPLASFVHETLRRYLVHGLWLMDKQTELIWEESGE